jgi:hypothetical protein
MLTRIALTLVILLGCSSHHTPSMTQSDNAAWIHEACSNPDKPTLVMGKHEVGCCQPFNGFLPDRDACIGIHKLDDPGDNFCNQTPLGGMLVIQPDGQWWCCSAGQCGH